MYYPFTQNRILATEQFDFLRCRAVRFHRIQSLFRKNTRIKCFNALKDQLNEKKQYAGLKQIRVNQIVGSVGRANDYDRFFRPLKKNLAQRWVNIALLWEQAGWEAIQVYKVKNEYYVLDGHHRVSVAYALGAAFIDAEVWEIENLDTIQIPIPCSVKKWNNQRKTTSCQC